MKNKHILILSSMFVFAMSCGNGDKKETTQNNTTPIVVIVSQPNALAANGLFLSGKIVSSTTANISTRIMGYITSMHVKAGDKVSAGQLIATISSDDIVSKKAQTDAMIMEAEAALKNAQKDLDRFTNLYKQQSATAKELDNVTLQYNSMKAKLEATKQMRNEVNAQLAYTRLTAPFAGVVTQKLADAGSMATPGMPLAIIERSGSLQVEVLVPETEIQNIKLKQAVMVEVKSISKKFAASIVEINPSSQYTGGQFSIKINIPEKEKPLLNAGMYVNVEVETKDNAPQPANENTVMVPLSSIVYKDQLTGIYTVSETNTALLRWIRLGKTINNQAEVLSGLNKNETYIISAEGKLFNGALVQIKK